jgi:hypothetical protein
MAVLVRITDFIPNTLIQSQQVDDEFNQLVNLLSGVSTSKDTLLKYNHATDPVLRVDQLGAGLIQQWLHNGTSRASLSALGKLLLPAGIGAAPSADQTSNFGTYFTDVAVRQTGADTTETDFSVKAMAANTLGADGDFILFFSRLVYAANANTKRYRVYYESSAIFDTGAVAFNGVNQFLIGLIYREGSTVLSTIFANIVGTAINPAVSVVAISPTSFSVSRTLKTTGQNGTASAGDIIQAGVFMVKGSV